MKGRNWGIFNMDVGQRLWLRAVVSFLAGIFFLSGCSSTKETLKRYPQSGDRFSIAVYPVENLSGTKAPIQEIKQLFIGRLRQMGFDVLGEEAIEKFMVNNRIRYTGGLDWATSKAFKEQIGVKGVLILSLELYNEERPPKIAMTSRLVSTGGDPKVLWIDGVGLAGDDSPGLLGLGLVEDPKILISRAIQSLTDSLAEYFSNRADNRDLQKVKNLYRPKIGFRSPLLERDRKYSLAVIPFFNVSERKYAGEVMVLHFVRLFREFENFDIIEPGFIKQEFLDLRIIMEDGISLAQADALFSTLNVDLILGGKVMDYQDYRGIWGKAKVDFSAQLIERKHRMVVWSSRSYNDGEEGIFLFDRGKVNTAQGLASRMVRSIGNEIVRGK